MAVVLGESETVNDQDQGNERLTEPEKGLADDVSSINEIYRLSTQLLRPADLHTALEQILDACMEIVGAPMGMVQVYDTAREALDIAAQRGFNEECLDYFREVSAEDGLAFGRAMAAGKRVVIEDVECDPQFAPHRPIAASAGYRAVQSTPLVSRGGNLLGVVSTHFTRSHR